MQAYLEAIERADLVNRTGKVVQFFGLVVESTGPDVFLGERCEIFSKAQDQPVAAEVVGIKDGRVLLMPFGEIRGIRLGSDVVASGKPVSAPVCETLLGRVIDAFGEPLDQHGDIKYDCEFPLYVEGTNPLQRPRIEKVLETGVKVIDTLLTLGKGQRVGIFAGSGVGKSTLLGMIARNMDADVNVIALVGERGREVRDFIEQTLGEEGLKKSVVVVATADQPALVRTHAALAATAIAEYFRARGKDVVLTMDSVTRFAMAQREIGLSIGEPPTARGYTPSVFSMLSRLLERGGTCSSGGSITAFYTVLVEGDDDINDPIADSIRAILDGHIILSRDLANYRRYPAVDVLQSNSRLLEQLLTPDELAVVDKSVKLLGEYERVRDMIEIGAYQQGSNKELDHAIAVYPKLVEFLGQKSNIKADRSNAVKKLREVVRV